MLPMLEQSKLWIEHLAGGIEIAAAAIVGLAAAEAVWKALPLFLRRGLRQDIKLEVRLSLGRWLALGLEFALAADILRTAVAPTWRDIGQLAAIAVLRTGLNYSLELEIAREEGRAFTCAARASSDSLLRCASESPPTTSSSLPYCSSDKVCHLSLPTLRDRCSPRGPG